MSAEVKHKVSGSAKSEQNDGFDWNAENEVHLFYALKGHKPVGVNRHFHMICIQDLFNNLVNKEVSSKVIWDHLDRLYDMEALHENEDIPFPNDEIDFSLPSSEFDELITRKVNGKSDDHISTTKNETLTTAGRECLQSESEISVGKEKKDENKADTKVDVASEKQKESSQKEEKDTKTVSSAKKRNQKTPSTNSRGGQTPNNSNGNTSSKKRRA